MTTSYLPKDLATAKARASHTCTVPPVYFSEELAGPGGMAFSLFVEPQLNAKDLAAACRWLRGNRDVVSITLARPAKQVTSVDIDLEPSADPEYLAFARMAKEFTMMLPTLNVTGAVNRYKVLNQAYIGLEIEKLSTLQQMNAPLVLQMAGGRLLTQFPEALI